MEIVQYTDTAVHQARPPADFGSDRQASVQAAIDHASVLRGARLPGAFVVSKEDENALKATFSDQRTWNQIETFSLGLNYLRNLALYEQAIELEEAFSKNAGSEVKLSGFKFEKRNNSTFHADHTFARSTRNLKCGGLRISRELFVKNTGSIDMLLAPNTDQGSGQAHTLDAFKALRVEYNQEPIVLVESVHRNARFATSDGRIVRTPHPPHRGVAGKRSAFWHRGPFYPRAVVVADYTFDDPHAAFNTSLTHEEIKAFLPT